MEKYHSFHQGFPFIYIHLLDIFWIYPPATVADRGLGWDFQHICIPGLKSIPGPSKGCQMDGKRDAIFSQSLCGFKKHHPEIEGATGIYPNTYLSSQASNIYWYSISVFDVVRQISILFEARTRGLREVLAFIFQFLCLIAGAPQGVKQRWKWSPTRQWANKFHQKAPVVSESEATK